MMAEQQEQNQEQYWWRYTQRGLAALAMGLCFLSTKEAGLLKWWSARGLGLKIALFAVCAVFYSVVHLLDYQGGLVREMWYGADSGSPPAFRCVDKALDFSDHRLRADLYSARTLFVRWTGHVPGPKSQITHLFVEHDGRVVIRQGERTLYDEDFGDVVQTQITETGFGETANSLVIEYLDSGGASHVSVRIEHDSGVSLLGGARVFQVPEAVGWSRHIGWITFLSGVGGIGLIALVILTLANAPWQRVEEYFGDRFHRGAVMAVIVIVAIGLRLWMLIRADFMTLADEAIVGVMGMHILAGKALPCLFYGQFYGGPLESYLLVPFFAVFGINTAVLKMLPLLLGVLIVFPVYAIARRMASNTGALLAASYIAFPPLMCALYSLMAMIGPVEIPLLGIVYAALLLKRFAAMDADSAGDSPWDEFFMGLVAGLGFWVNAQVLYFLLPCELLLLLRGRPLLLRFWWPCPGTIGLFLGMFPLLYYSFFTGWEPFKFLLFGGGPRYSTPYAVFWNSLMGQCLPEILGGRPRWVTGHDVYYPALAGLVFWSFLGACFFALARLFTLRGKRWPEWLLALIALTIPFIFCFSTFGERAYSRYLYAAFPVIPLILVTALTALGRRLRTPVVMIGLAIVAVHARGLLLENPALFFQHEENIGAGRLLPGSNENLIGELSDRGIDAINTDFWIGWNVAYASREGIVQDDWLDRYPAYRERFQNSVRPGYVFHNNEQRGEWQIDGLDELFTLLNYECLDAAPYRVYVPRQDGVPRARWKAFASENAGAAGLAIDGDFNAFSAWASEGSQKPGAFLLVDIDEARALERIVIHWGPNRWNAPVNAQLLLSPDGQNWSAPIPLGPCEKLNGSWAGLDGATVRMFKVEITTDVPDQPWTVYDVFVE